MTATLGVIRQTRRWWPRRASGLPPGQRRRHGAPLRLVSPAQYGYKNVKHVESIALRSTRPVSLLGPKEHLRARVALEERHSRIPGRLLRWPYRLAIPITVIVAERTLQGQPGNSA